MAAPETLRDNKKMATYHREYKAFQGTADLYYAYQKVVGQLRETKELANHREGGRFPSHGEGGDRCTGKAEGSFGGGNACRTLASTDPNDNRHAILEIRAGTGGDEAALFATGSVQDVYALRGRQQAGQMELVDLVEASHGGYKEVIANVVGAGVYGRLKYESGVHRVQRVPDTEAQGRRSHLSGHCGGLTRDGRGGGRHQHERSATRHVLLFGAGGAVSEHHLLGSAPNPPAHQRGGDVPRREVSNQEF